MVWGTADVGIRILVCLHGLVMRCHDETLFKYHHQLASFSLNNSWPHHIASFASSLSRKATANRKHAPPHRPPIPPASRSHPGYPHPPPAATHPLGSLTLPHPLLLQHHPPPATLPRPRRDRPARPASQVPPPPPRPRVPPGPEILWQPLHRRPHRLVRPRHLRRKRGHAVPMRRPRQ